MPSTIRTLLALLLAGLLALTLGQVATAHHANPPGPIHAGNTFGWWKGGHVQRWEYETPRLPRYWKKEGRGIVRNQYGMLTLYSKHRGSVSATLDRRGHRYGRWEIRLRHAQFGRGHTRYAVITELVPAGDRDQRCGAKNIALNYYRPFDKAARTYVNTLPDLKFRGLKGLRLDNNRWHTFAVEVTRTHVSWFVDAHVIRTERRAAALSGVPMTVRFTLKGEPGHRMNRTRMQMDWLRYWSLKAPNTKSIRAPRLEKVTNPSAC